MSQKLDGHFEQNPAFVLEANGRKEVDVRVLFDRGKPSNVTFFDSDRDAMVSVPFELWDRVIRSVELTVEWHRVDDQ